jgi:hypothetical protein
MTTSITHFDSAETEAVRMNEPAHDPDPEVPEKAKRRRFSARYKAEVLAIYDQLPASSAGPSFVARGSTSRVSPSGGRCATAARSRRSPGRRDAPRWTRATVRSNG